MPNYWLIKTEPTSYSLSDLEREKTTCWTGVGNPTAKKHLRAMEKGDLVFVYHTGNEKQIVGIAEVVTSGQEPKIRYQGGLPRAVRLAEIKARKEFTDWELVRIGRLSVMPVKPVLWKLVWKMVEK